jgi:hypothetical protein
MVVLTPQTALHIPRYSGAIAVEFMTTEKYVYQKSFIHKSSTSPRKMLMLELKHDVLTLYCSCKNSRATRKVMYLADPIPHTCYIARSFHQEIANWIYGCLEHCTLDRFLDMTEFTTLTPSSQISCKLAFPIVGLKISSVPALQLKSPKII